MIIIPTRTPIIIPHSSGGNMSEAPQLWAGIILTILTIICGLMSIGVIKLTIQDLDFRDTSGYIALAMILLVLTTTGCLGVLSIWSFVAYFQ